MTSVRVVRSLAAVVALVVVVALVGARPQHHGDLVAAATGHHHGRVQIKVYRGPDEHGGHHEHFAPHGYWIKQPADDDHHRRR